MPGNRRSPRSRRLVAIIAASISMSLVTPAKAEDFWECPEGYAPKEGLNTDFPADGLKRAFVVIAPKQSKDPDGAPVWAPMTGTVEATEWNLHVVRSGNNAALADAGFMVVAPIRQNGCSGSVIVLACIPESICTSILKSSIAE